MTFVYEKESIESSSKNAETAKRREAPKRKALRPKRNPDVVSSTRAQLTPVIPQVVSPVHTSSSSDDLDILYIPSLDETEVDLESDDTCLFERMEFYFIDPTNLKVFIGDTKDPKVKTEQI